MRFALDASTFVGRLLDLARAANVGPETHPDEHVQRLSLDDLYLATACSLGDENAWEELAERHLGFVRDFARRFLGEAEAQDLAGQVVADLWQRRKIGRFEGRSTLRTWLGAVVAHAALNAMKAGRRAAPLGPEENPGDGSQGVSEPLGNESRALLAQVVADAIAGLAADEKVLLHLYYEQGLTLDQMAVVHHTSKTALSRRLTRIRSGLRAAIESRSRRMAGASADALRAGVDLGHLDLDLGDLLGPGPDRTAGEGAVSNSQAEVRARRLPGGP